MNSTTSPTKEANLLSTSNYSPELIAAIGESIDALKWVAVIVCAYLVHEWVTNDDDDEPDGYA